MRWITATATVTGLGLALASLQSAQAYESNPLRRELLNVRSSLCKSLDLKCQRKARNAARRKSTQPGGAAAKPSAAENTPASSPPIPRPKPADLALPKAPAEPVPIPRPDPRKITTAVTPVAPPQPNIAVAIPQSPVLPDGNCTAALKAAHADYAVAAAPAAAGPCQVDGAVNLKSVETLHGRVAFPEAPLLNCRFAAQFATWVATQASPLTAANTGSPLAKVWTGPGYDCRGRNGDISAKISEHGFGNAVDITTMATADGKQMQVADAIATASSSYPALKAMRASACMYFTTVLGPGANSAHASHFHLDLGKHGKSNTYRICE